MNVNDFKKQLIKTGKSKKNMEIKIKELNQNFDLTKVKSNFRYYESNVNKNKSHYAYVTIIFGGYSYVPAVLALGHSLRMSKTKNKLICIVQDKDEYEFKGLNINLINEINNIYDLVVGVDLLKTNFNSEYFLKNKEHYKNIQYYTTKNQILGLYEFKKIIFLDSSCIVKENIDYIFDNYNLSTYKYNEDYDEFLITEMGLHGNFLFIIPSIEIYNKALILINNYEKYFENEYFIYSNDEIIFFFSIYPNWNNKQQNMFSNKTIDKTYKKNLIFNKNVNHEIYKNNSDVYKYVIDKPFRYNKTFNNSCLDNNTLINYIEWDLIVKNLIDSNKKYKKYFKYIKTFRNVFF
jgi:alpha-N-acetylglucosamine transferase